MKYFVKYHWGQVLLASLSFALFYSLALPSQTYLSNVGMFAYGYMELLAELSLYFAVLLMGSFLIGMLSAPILGRLLPLLFILAGICGYLEVGIFSIGLPPLNGQTWWFNRATIRKYLDILIFLSLAGGCLVFSKCLFKVLHWIALAFMVMCVAFVFDVRGPSHGTVKPTAFDDGFCPFNDMVRSASFSTNRNVLIICLDSASAKQADEIMRDDEKLREHFPGFVAYANNIGMHDCTTKGVPPLVTGRYCEKNDLEQENNRSFWGEHSVLNQYLSAGYDMYVRMAIGSSYTNRRKVFSPGASLPQRRWVLDRYSKTSPYLTLKDVLRFRLVPFRKKFGVLKRALVTGYRLAFKQDVDMGREWNLYPVLKSAHVSDDPKAKSFFLFHTEGVHVPIMRDRNGAPLAQGIETREAIGECLHYLLKEVGALMDSFRARGIYDNSMIVLTTDHGMVSDPKYALLWVKPFKGNAPYSVSQAATSHAKIASLLAMSVDSDLGSEQIAKVLTMRERKLRIRQCSPEKWWQFGRLVDTYDFIYDENGKEISRECLGEFVLL